MVRRAVLCCSVHRVISFCVLKLSGFVVFGVGFKRRQLHSGPGVACGSSLNPKPPILTPKPLKDGSGIADMSYGTPVAASAPFFDASPDLDILMNVPILTFEINT